MYISEMVNGVAETSAMNLGTSVDENCSKINRVNSKTPTNTVKTLSHLKSSKLPEGMPYKRATNCREPVC